MQVSCKIRSLKFSTENQFNLKLVFSCAIAHDSFTKPYYSTHESTQKVKREATQILDSLICSPNTTYTDGFNECYCAHDGLFLACTEKRSPSPPIGIPFPTCIPNTHFNVDCAFCICGATGLPRYCSYVKCNEELYGRSLKAKSRAHSTMSMKVGEFNDELPQTLIGVRSLNLKDKVNMMTVRGDGSKFQSIAQKMKSLAVERSSNIYPKGQCTPGDLFRSLDGDSFCLCPSNGDKSRSICTNSTCTPGELFEADDGCNTCICPSIGFKLNTNCSKKSCSSTLEKICTPGQLFRPDHCNRCTCNENGRPGICTHHVCPIVSSTENLSNFRCTPGKSFSPDADDCNVCTCSESGDMVCTRMICI